MLDERILPVGNVGKVEVFEQKIISAKNLWKMTLLAVYTL